MNKIYSAALASVLLLGLGLRSQAADDSSPKIAPTLAQDMKTLTVPLLPGYENQKHPRLLFSADDLPAIQKKAKDFPDLWNPVLMSAKRLATVPAADVIQSGAKYWRIEEVESGALAYLVTRNKTDLENVRKWLLAHCQEKIWGTGFRSNLDLQASWYLYHLSLAYDMLHDELPEADRKIIVAGLSAHAKAIYDSLDPAQHPDKYSFDQNHTYIPAVALSAASLTLLGEAPEAKDWLKLAYGVMRRSRHVLGDDGYYYEGYGYWFYALHWHVRYADLIVRATGEKALDLPALKNNWQFGLQLALPGNPGAFDVGDASRWVGNDRPMLTPKNYAIYWDLATAAKNEGLGTAGENKAVADMYQARSPDLDYPAASFLWYASTVTATPLSQIKPYHHFPDADVVTWRSGWDDNATCFFFRCGPPEGHAAAAKLKAMQDWGPNAGHVHPDIGSFYLFAKGNYLAVTTGYTAEKWTRDHNTLLVDGKGQGADGAYWNDRGVPYEKFNACRMKSVYLSDDYAFASGEFGEAYVQTPGVKLTRSCLATKRYVLIVDDMSADKDHKLTRRVHANAEFKPDGTSAAMVAKLAKASLAVIPIGNPAGMESTAQPTKVMAGSVPGKGVETQRGYELSLAMKTPAKTARLINLLVPLSPDEAPPTVDAKTLDGDTITFDVHWPDKKVETVTVNLAGGAADKGPATFHIK